MTAALAEAPGVAWFVPVAVPGRSPVRPPARPATRPKARPSRPARRRLAVVGPPPSPVGPPPSPVGPPPSPVGPRVHPAAGPSSPPAARLRLTRRGSHVVALAVLALAVLGGVGRLEAGPTVGAASITRIAPGTPLTSSGGLAVELPGR